MSGSWRAHPGKARIVGVLVVLALIVGIVVQFRYRIHRGLYWIEAHGKGELTTLAAVSSGVIGTGLTQDLYRYPGEWSEPWKLEESGKFKFVSGRDDFLVAIKSSGEVAWYRPQKQTIPGSIRWQATALAVASTGTLYVLSKQHAQVVLDDKLAPSPCSELVATSLAAARDTAWVISEGSLYRDDGVTCTPEPKQPPGVKFVASNDDRAAVIDRAGGIWMLSSGRWTELPKIRKLRADHLPSTKEATGLALGDTTTYALDVEHSVFILSEQP